MLVAILIIFGIFGVDNYNFGRTFFLLFSWSDIVRYDNKLHSHRENSLSTLFLIFECPKCTLGNIFPRSSEKYHAHGTF